MSATMTITRLFLSRLFANRQAWLLPVAAFGVVSALSLSVAGGVHFFFNLDEATMAQTGGLYMILASLAAILLVVPVASLAAAAAKLLARRRDERLSSLRLLGASARLLRTLAVVEAAVLAVVGSLVGVIGYVLLLPLSGLLRFAGGPFCTTGMLLGVTVIMIVIDVIVQFVVVGSIIYCI